MRPDQPLLSRADLQALIAECDQGCDTLAVQLISLKQRLGPYASPYLGSGFEYQESRPYQPGDPIRQLNWRYFARTGQLYTRLYEQERQERLFIAVDQRDVMRFGTRVRPKVAQAVRLALALVHLAVREGMAVQIQPLHDQGALSPVFSGAQAFERAEALLNQPCPPGEPTPDGWESLTLAVEQLPAGSLLVLIGDLWDMDVRFARWLGAQAPHKVAQAIWVQDPVETHLPETGGFVLHDLAGQHAEPVDGARAAAYNDTVRVRFQQRRQQLLAAGLALYRLQAHQSLTEYAHG